MSDLPQCRDLDAFYVFCFTRRCEPQYPSVGAVGYGTIEQVAAGDLAAVVAPVSAGEFRDESLTRDLEWVEPRARLHDEVVRAVMREQPVMPVKFGAVFSSRQAVRAYLDRHAEQVGQFVTRMDGLAEWSVKGYGQQAAPEKSLAGDAASAGRNYLLQRSRSLHGQRDLQRRQAEMAAEVQAALSEVCIEMRELRLHAPPVTGRAEPMLLNVALLVSREQCDALVACVEELRRGYERDGLVLELGGPWPPYSFCPVLDTV